MLLFENQLLHTQYNINIYYAQSLLTHCTHAHTGHTNTHTHTHTRAHTGHAHTHARTCRTHKHTYTHTYACILISTHVNLYSDKGTGRTTFSDSKPIKADDSYQCHVQPMPASAQGIVSYVTDIPVDVFREF